MITLKKTILTQLLLGIALISFAQEQQLTLNLYANSLKYDAKRNCFYATVNTTDSLYGNKFVKINPKTGQIEASITIGQNPTCMDLTKDTNYVYVGFDQDSVVKRIDLSRFLVDRVIPIYGAESKSRKACDVASVNLSPEMVVIATKWYNNGISGGSKLLCNYKGKYIGDTIIYEAIYSSLESSKDTNIVFSNSTGDFCRYQVDTINGLTNKYSNSFLSINLNEDFKISNKLAISKHRYAYNVFETPMTEAGLFRDQTPPTLYNCFDIDTKNNRVYFGLKDQVNLLVARFDLSTKSYIDMPFIRHMIPNLEYASLLNMFRYDEFGIAMLIDNSTMQGRSRIILFSESCVVKEGVDLVVSNNLPRNKKYIGDTAEVFVKVVNRNSLTANQVNVQTYLNPAFDILSIRVSSGSTMINDSVISWDFDSISYDEIDTLFLLIRYKQAGEFDFISSVSSKTFDCLSANNNNASYFVVEYPTGLNDFESLNTVTLFPNPVSDFITIEFGNNITEPLALKVIDIHGKSLIQQELIKYDKNHLLDLKNLIPGVYFIQIENIHKQVKYLKMVKM